MHIIDNVNWIPCMRPDLLESELVIDEIIGWFKKYEG